MLDGLRRNMLLAALPEEELERLGSLVEIVDAEIRLQVYEPRELIKDVYFPLSSIFSLVALAEEEQIAVEVCTIGFEGMVGLPVFLGAQTSPNAAFCQVAGEAARMTAPDLIEFLRSDGVLHRRLHRFTQATMVQMAQNVTCNSLHAVEQRACRWLLMTSDRVRSDQFLLTQEFLAQMLGARRPTVSDVAARLQSDGLIRYSRGVVTVSDREALVRRSCECYLVLRAEFDSLGSES